MAETASAGTHKPGDETADREMHPLPTWMRCDDVYWRESQLAMDR